MGYIVGSVIGISLHVEDCRAGGKGCNMCPCALLISDEVIGDEVVRGMVFMMSGFNE